MTVGQHDELDALVAQARRASAPALTPLEARRAVRLAVDAAEAATLRRPRLGWLLVACALVGLVCAILWFAPRGTTIEVAASGRPLRIALASGDSLVAAPGTQLDVLAQDVARRELRLRAGSALFDVARLGPTQRFEVHTQHADVRVRGTVFSVEVVAGRTIVRVYEGRVWVADHDLSAGEVWVSSGAAARFDGDPLVSDGRAAAALREQAPGLTVRAMPDVSPSEVARPPGPDAALPPLRATLVVATGLPAAGPALEEARAWLLAGESERALRAAQAPGERDQPGWLLLEADSLRALHRDAEAVERYRRLAEQEPSLRASAGYEAASLAFHALKEPARALALIEALALDAHSSPLRERASVLHVDVLLALGRADDARAQARSYLQREPETEVSRRMRALVR